MKARVHLHSHKEPKGRAYIVADRRGLLALAAILQRAANNMIGLETIELYSSDGHPYNLVITTADEEEWQKLSVPYDKTSDPSQLDIIKIYDSTRKEVEEKNVGVM